MSADGISIFRNQEKQNRTASPRILLISVWLPRHYTAEQKARGFWRPHRSLHFPRWINLPTPKKSAAPIYSWLRSMYQTQTKQTIKVWKLLTKMRTHRSEGCAIHPNCVGPTKAVYGPSYRKSGLERLRNMASGCFGNTPKLSWTENESARSVLRGSQSRET